MFILKKGHQPGVYVPLRALFLVWIIFNVFCVKLNVESTCIKCCLANVIQMHTFNMQFNGEPMLI